MPNAEANGINRASDALAILDRDPEMNIAGIVGYLADTIGLPMTAAAANVNTVRPAQAWLEGRAKPNDRSRARLRVLYRVVRAIETARPSGGQAAKTFLAEGVTPLGQPLIAIRDALTPDWSTVVLNAARSLLEA